MPPKIAPNDEQGRRKDQTVGSLWAVIISAAVCVLVMLAAAIFH